MDGAVGKVEKPVNGSRIPCTLPNPVLRQLLQSGTFELHQYIDKSGVGTGNGMSRLDTLLAGRSLLPDEQEFYWLWIFATITYGIGDILTTLTILTVDLGIDESNLLIRHVFTHLGGAGIVGLKLIVFFIGLAISVAAAELWHDRNLYYAPPIMLTLLGGIATVNNLYLLLFH